VFEFHAGRPDANRAKVRPLVFLLNFRGGRAMKKLGYCIALALLMSLTSALPTQAATAVKTSQLRSAAASTPVETVVWRRGVRGYGPYGGAGYRAYYRPYYQPYYGGYYGGYRPYYSGYRPYYGAYYGGWYY
jgi:hypothetical protein